MSESETSRAVIYWLLINTDTQPKVSSVVGKVLCIGCETSQTEVAGQKKIVQQVFEMTLFRGLEKDLFRVKQFISLRR